MIRQPFVLINGDPPVWTCAWCAAELRKTAILHADDCAWIAEIRAGGDGS